MARLHHRLYMTLGGLIVITLGAVVAGLIGAEYLILRPLNKLTRATAEVSIGEFDISDHLDASLPVMAHLMQSFHDMAENLKLREAELQENKAVLYETNRYLSMSEQVAHVGHWRVEFPSNRVTWSEEVFRIHGLDAKIITPSLETAIAAFHPDDRAEALRHITLARAQHCDYEFGLRIVRPSGEVRHILSRGFCELGANGEVSALFGAVVDITALKEIEAKLKHR